METRNILTEHSRQTAEQGVQWLQQHPWIVSGIELKPVSLKDLNDTKQNFTLLHGHMQFCQENDNKERKLDPEEIDNLLLGLLPIKQESGSVNNVSITKCFKNNVASVHEGNKEISCSSCNKTFNANSSLKRHIASVHEGLEFSCSFCGRTKKENSD